MSKTIKEENNVKETENENTVEKTEDEVKEKKENKDKGSKDSVKNLEAQVKTLEDELKKNEAKIEELTDRYQRMMAEYDNFRKRSAKEKETIYSDAYIDVVSEMLPILDNLERALGFADGEKLTDGVRMICNQFKETFTKMGVEEISVEGGFNPEYHNAVMHIEDENYGENEVVDVLQKGYKKNDKVIRHAMVRVAN